jgi:NAD(P)H-dependent FMN reductase
MRRAEDPVERPDRPVRVLAISGSLRSESSNTAALRALALLGGSAIEVRVYDGIASLPYFNPDLDGQTTPASVASLRSAVAASDAVVLCSPEYAQGVPGVLKNALEWLVGGAEMSGKPVALLSTSPWSGRAQASLVDTVSALGARLVRPSPVALPLRGRHLEPHRIAAEPSLRSLLLRVLIALEGAANEGSVPAGTTGPG